MSDLFRIRTNIPALDALHNLDLVNRRIIESQARMATGKLVNKASDDPATFVAARLFETSISAYVSKQKEIERGVDWLETNNARLDQIADILIECINLTNTANSGSITSAEQQAISREIALLVEQIDQVLLSGVAAELWEGFTIGNLEDVSLTGTVPPTASSLSLNGTNLIVTGTSAQFDTTLNNLQNALDEILIAEETLGTYVKRLEFEFDDMAVSEVAARAQLSTVADADLAEEQVNLTALLILQQTSMAGLVQANNAPAAVLSLIGQ
jgi:flagellin